MEDVYSKLGLRLLKMYEGWWMPSLEKLKPILEQNLDPAEAEVALALPTDSIPLETVGLDDIASKTDISRQEVKEVLEKLVSRGLLFSGKTRGGKRGYAHLRSGYGFWQTWFWKREKSAHAKRMADLLWQYHFPVAGMRPDKMFPRSTKIWRYVPLHGSVDEKEVVYPFEIMQEIVRKAKVIALAHCACRVKMELATGVSCGHPQEVCMKFDELAEHLVNIGLARELTVDGALDILKKSEEAGLVHFAENAREGIKHNCNCCGCACWNVGAIRRKTIPRDRLMAVYFVRETDEDSCIGCGTCVDICPVNAVAIDKNGKSVTDEGLCIGCGVCVLSCPSSAIKLVRRVDVRPPKEFAELHRQVMKEKGFGILTRA